MGRSRKRKLSFDDELKIENSIKKIEAILANQTDLQFLLKDERVCRSLKRLKRSRDASDVHVVQDAIEDRLKQYEADNDTIEIISGSKTPTNASNTYFGTVYASHGETGSYVVTSAASTKTRLPETQVTKQAPIWHNTNKPFLRHNPAVAQFCKELLSLENDKENDKEPTSPHRPVLPLPKCMNWLQGRNSSLILPEYKLLHDHSANPQNFLRFVNGITDEPPPTFKYITAHVWHSSYQRPKVPKEYLEHCRCDERSDRSEYKAHGNMLCENCDCSDRRGSSDANGFYDVENPGRLLTTTSIWEQSHPSLIVECNVYCGCDPQVCSNRVMQKQSRVPIMVVERMKDKGWGCVTLETIEKGTFVCEYVGEIISESDAEMRGKEYDAQGLSYLWTQKTDHAPTIDATRMGNISRFVNHSCDPNLFACEILVESRQMAHIPRIAFFAKKRIHIGEELTIDYAYELSDHPKQFIRCACGSSNCRGRIR